MSKRNRRQNPKVRRARAQELVRLRRDFDRCSARLQLLLFKRTDELLELEAAQ